MNKLKTAVISADWKDIEGLIEEFKRVLPDFGVSIIDHPDFEGTDTFGFIISGRELTPEEIKAETIREGE